MGKKKEKENLAEELAKSFERWECLKEHGGSDPSYADGTNMNLVRNHIMYYKNRMVEEYCCCSLGLSQTYSHTLSQI